MWNWQSGDSEEVPEWASFFRADEYRDFIEAVVADLQRRSDQVEIDRGVARMVCDTEEHRFGLQNLAQICNQVDVEVWPEIIKGHFDGVIRSSAGADLETLAENWDRARAMIKVRLYPAEAVAETLPGLVFREVADGLLAVLTYDLPEAVATVPRSDLDKWPITMDEAFELGLDNVLEQDEVLEEEVHLDSGASFTAMIGDSFYVTSRMLALGRTIESDFGALVAVPNRHTLLVAPIVDLRVVEILNAMLAVAHQRHAEGPGSLTPDLFWYRGPDVPPMTLVADIDDEHITFSPPDEFVEACLNHLPPPRQGYGPN